MTSDFFHPRSNRLPKIYGYTELTEDYSGLIRIGYTERDLYLRMQEHYPTAAPEGIERYKILFEEPSMREDGTYFKDHQVHKILEKAGFKRSGSKNDWFRCSVDDLKAAFIAVKEKTSIDLDRVFDFPLRPEQKQAIECTCNYFKTYTSIERKIPHFLWNCKMRFGKTFTAYKLMQKMNWSRILILTFKPAVENSWKEDLETHIDFKSWNFISKASSSFEKIKDGDNVVCFASFQDFLGKNEFGGIKVKNQWVHEISWDCIIFDEYHYGAWNEKAKGILSKDDLIIENERELIEKEEGNQNMQMIWDEELSPLKTKHYLYLSGTPFRAIASGEFIEEQIFNWTYSDEQNAKTTWKGGHNPYESLPRMVMMTYQMPESLIDLTSSGEYDQFDLNEFFKATGDGDKAEFKHKSHVQKWLDLLRGDGFNNIYTNLKLGNAKPVLPFNDSRLLNLLNHTFWFLPSVASCYAMKNLLNSTNNIFFHNYEVIVCAGKKAGIGLKALDPVIKKMANPLKSKTITLSCGKLNTGITVRPWSGLFMLRNTSSPETYFQTAFRIQSPWTIGSESHVKEEIILKKDCYLFDFAPNRALKLLSEYSCKLNVEQKSSESKVDDFIKFLPVICFDGSSMRQINAQEVLDFALVGTSGSQLAKKFESSRLVNVDDFTLKKIMNNPDAMEALMKIESFRNLNNDIEKIINHSEKIKKLKKDTNLNKDKNKIKKVMTEEEKKRKNLRQELQEKLLNFAARIPIFMYLTDFREETLKDVITKLEPGLFKRVTSLSIQDFDLLVSLGVFDNTLMNAAIFSFKRYENASLHYAGITKYNFKEIGLFDTKLSSEDFQAIEDKNF